MHLVVLTYPEDLTPIDAALAAHVEWLDGLYAEGLLLASGRRNPRVGGVLLFRDGVGADVVAARLAQDPFSAAGTSYEVVDFTPSKHADDFPVAEA